MDTFQAGLNIINTTYEKPLLGISRNEFIKNIISISNDYLEKQHEKMIVDASIGYDSILHHICNDTIDCVLIINIRTPRCESLCSSVISTLVGITTYIENNNIDKIVVFNFINGYSTYCNYVRSYTRVV